MRIDALNIVDAAQPDAARKSKASGEVAAPEPSKRSLQGVAEPEMTVAAAARQIESYLKSVGRTLEFRVDADTNKTVVTVRDSVSGEVIRQIPGDEALHLARRLAAGAGGLVDLKV